MIGQDKSIWIVAFFRFTKAVYAYMKDVQNLHQDGCAATGQQLRLPLNSSIWTDFLWEWLLKKHGISSLAPKTNKEDYLEPPEADASF
jgi:hypothetical protein